MKKIGTFILFILFLFFCSSVLAETDKSSFTLPASLEFGMQFDKAAAVSGFKVYDATDDIYDYESQIVSNMGFDTNYLSGTATVGGEKREIQCYFVLGQLRQVVYHIKIDVYDDETSAKESLNNLEATLSSKYGSGEKKTHRFSPFKKLSWKDNGDILKPEMSIYGDIGTVTRLIPYNEGSLYIDDYLVNYTYKNTDKDYSYHAFWQHFLTYTFYDFELDDGTEQNTDYDF